MSFSLIQTIGSHAGHFLSGVASFRAQTHDKWEVLLVPGPGSGQDVLEAAAKLAEEDCRFRLVESSPSESAFMSSRGGEPSVAPALNAALDLATGDFVLCLDSGDRLAPRALGEVARSILPDTALVITGEDMLTMAGNLARPFFKPADWDARLLSSHLYPGKSVWLKRERLLEANGWRDGFPGFEHFDLILRYAERLEPALVVTLPGILYHAREKQAPRDKGGPSGEQAVGYGVRALQQHLKRMGRKGKAQPLTVLQNTPVAYEVRYALPDPIPSAMLIVAGKTGESASAVRDAARDIAARTEYPGSWSTVSAFGPEHLAEVLGQADADVVVLVDSGLVPDAASWMVDLAAYLTWTGAGAVGPATCDPDGHKEYFGYVADDQGCFSPAYERGAESEPLSSEAPGYMGMALLAHRVAGLDQRAVLLAGNNAALLSASLANSPAGTDLDLCHVLAENGLDCAILPRITLRRRPDAMPFAVPEGCPALRRTPSVPCLRSPSADPVLHWVDMPDDDPDGIPDTETLLEDGPVKTGGECL